MKSVSFGAFVAALLAVASLAHADATVSPGKNSAYTTLSSQPITNAYTNLAQVGLIKGKRNHVVEVEVTLIDKSYVSTTLRTYATINGIEMEVNQASAQANDNCGGNYINCTISGMFWADLDALEATNPGSFIGQPLLIDAHGLTTTGTIATVSMRARLLRK